MGQLLLGDEYDRLFRRNKHLCARLVAAHRENAGGGEHTDAVNVRSGNRNARCFRAIEVENQVSRKHLLGGAVNAAALGRIGVVVGWTPDKLNALLKLRSYFDFLSAVGKPSFSASNLLILAPEQLESALLGRVNSRGHD